MDIFYVAFREDYMTERGKEVYQKFGGKFDADYYWFEFPSLDKAKEFVHALNEGRKYGRIDIINEHVTEGLTYQAYIANIGQLFDGNAGEIFTLAS